jgi:tetratricopeptide (TPR) repeat protein
MSPVSLSFSLSLCFAVSLFFTKGSLPVLAAPDVMTSGGEATTSPTTVAPTVTQETTSTPAPPPTATSGATSGAISSPAQTATPEATPAPAHTPSPAQAPTSASTSIAAPANDLAAEINKLDEMRIKGQCANAQIEQRLMPIADMQKQIVTLESVMGRSNPNVVMLYHLLARRYQQQAYVTGKFADSEKLYRWLTDTATAQQKGFDELLFGSAYLAMADGYRMTKRYDLALSTYQRALPVFLRGKKAAQVIIADYKTFGESAYEKQVKSSSNDKVKSLIVANKNFIEAIDKSQGNERYIASPVPDAYFGMAVCYLKKDDLVKAKEYLAKAKANGLIVVDVAKLKAAAAKKSGTKPSSKPASGSSAKKSK